MESSFDELIFPFDNEWKFHKADLIELKNSENGYLDGKCFYAYNIPGIQYFVRIFPFGDDEVDRGKAMVYLYVNGSDERKIAAEFVISVESADDTESFKNVYETDNTFGLSFCKTADFFDPESKYFINGEIAIRINGTFKAERPKIPIISCPISMQWKIKEEDLKAKKESNGCLRSKRFNVASFSDVKYHLSFCPNVADGENQGETELLLKIDMENEEKIEAVFDFNIDTAHHSVAHQDVYEEFIDHGVFLCSTDDLFNPSKGYIVDGYLTIDFNGILMKEKSQGITLNCKKGVAPKFALKKHDKDFLIVVDENEIQVHKQVLIDASPVLAGMFESGMKETTENKMSIEDFPFKIVDAAIKLCYRKNGPCKFAFEDMLLLYRFADKYRIQFIMDLIEDYLINKISPSTVVYLSKFSEPDSLNVKKLHQSCNQFLIKCFNKTTPVLGLDSLDEKFIVSLFLNNFRPVADTVDTES